MQRPPSHPHTTPCRGRHHSIALVHAEATITLSHYPMRLCRGHPAPSFPHHYTTPFPLPHPSPVSAPTLPQLMHRQHHPLPPPLPPPLSCPHHADSSSVQGTLYTGSPSRPPCSLLLASRHNMPRLLPLWLAPLPQPPCTIPTSVHNPYLRAQCGVRAGTACRRRCP